MRIKFILFLILIAGAGAFLFWARAVPPEQVIATNTTEIAQSADNSLNIVLNNIADSLKSEHILLERLNSISPDSKFATFVTVDNLGLVGSKLWLFNLESGESFIIDSQKPEIPDESNAYFGGISWSEDSSQFVYLKLYPTEIRLVDLKDLASDSTKSKVLITKFDKQDKDLLNPSIGPQGYSYIEWVDGKILFENNLTIPASIYSINLNTLEPSFYKENPLESEISQSGILIDQFYSQRDPRWQNLQLGGCKTQTLKSAGCAVSAMSMVVSEVYDGITPQSLNELLTLNNNQGYVFGCDIKWYAIPTFFEDLKLKGAYDNIDGDKRIKYELARGSIVVMGFKKVPQTGLQHWVVVKDFNNDEYILKDPWEESYIEKNLGDFGGNFDYLLVFEKAK